MLLPIEVKVTARPRVGDAKHLHTFRAEYGRSCRPGLVLHTGDAIEWLAAGSSGRAIVEGILKVFSACSIRVSTRASVRIERIVRNRESVKFLAPSHEPEGPLRLATHDLDHARLEIE